MTILSWFDLFLLYIIDVRNEAYLIEFVKQRELFDPETKQGFINDFLKLHEIDKIYAAPVTGNRTVIESVGRLRRSGMLINGGQFQVTTGGKATLTQLGREFKNWPMQAPACDGRIEFSKAIYFPEL